MQGPDNLASLAPLLPRSDAGSVLARRVLAGLLAKSNISLGDVGEVDRDDG